MKKRLLFFLCICILSGSFAQERTALPENLPATMTAWQAILLGVVEGVTEFLPISSTGHLLLAERILRISEDAASEQAMDTYTIVIQMGAILAVAWVYHEYLKRILLGVLGRDAGGRILLRNLLIAFFPAALIGVLFVDLIKTFLFGLWPVTLAWFVGGLALFVWGRKSDSEDTEARCCLETLTARQALIIGLTQIVAMVPGTSRSLVTILGGRWVGLSLTNSVVFSFLLGTITLSASTVYDLVRNGQQMIDTLGMGSLLLGCLTAFLSAWLAVRGLVQYLKQHGLGLFGGYRMFIAGVTAVLLLFGVLNP